MNQIMHGKSVVISVYCRAASGWNFPPDSSLTCCETCDKSYPKTIQMFHPPKLFAFPNVTTIMFAR